MIQHSERGQAAVGGEASRRVAALLALALVVVGAWACGPAPEAESGIGAIGESAPAVDGLPDPAGAEAGGDAAEADAPDQAQAPAQQERARERETAAETATGREAEGAAREQTERAAREAPPEPEPEPEPEANVALDDVDGVADETDDVMLSDGRGVRAAIPAETSDAPVEIAEPIIVEERMEAPADSVAIDAGVDDDVPAGAGSDASLAPDPFESAREDADTPPPYPWPPEPPSSIALLDAFVQTARGQTLGALSEELAAALVAADYADHRFYSAPGGFVLVTRLEEISEEGDALDGRERYRLPSDPRQQSFAEYLRGLFLEAPPGLWRYVAIVVSNRAIQFDATETLSSTEAVTRLTSGATRLGGALAAETFTDRHQATALIYEFRKTAADATAAQVAPGRIPPTEHLARTGIAAALTERFAAQ